MKTRLMKGRPRLVPKEDFQADESVNMWVDEKESDITSVSSSSTDGSHSIETEDNESMMTDEVTHGEESDDDDDDDEEEDEEDEDEDDEDDDDEESAMEQTIDNVMTEQTEKTVVRYNEVTPLFKAIINEEWDSVVTFLDTGSWGWKWSSLCAQLYQVSEKAAAAQVRTWVTSNKREGKGEITRLPLHAAIARDAPFGVIMVLVKSYGKGVKNPDSEGNYPLHLAFQRAATLQILTFLMQQFPDAIHLKNHDGKLPTECGAANGIANLMNLCIDATKNLVEKDLSSEKGNLEEDRKQLLEVTKELMNLKKIVAERERSMTKDNFLYQKQHLNTAISQLTKLKTDLDKHEDNVLQHHLVAEKKRMDGVLGELNKTKGELNKIKSEKKLTPAEARSPKASGRSGSPTSPIHLVKKKKKKPSSSPKKSTFPSYNPRVEEPGPEREDVNNFKEKDEVNPPVTGAYGGTEEQLIIETEQQEMELEESRDPNEVLLTPRTYGSEPNASPRKLKTLGSRFKKKMNWRAGKSINSPEAE